MCNVPRWGIDRKGTKPISDEYADGWNDCIDEILFHFPDIKEFKKFGEYQRLYSTFEAGNCDDCDRVYEDI